MAELRRDKLTNLTCMNCSTGDDGRESMTIEDIRKLLAKNITITLFAGDADYNCNWLGGEAVAQEINHAGYSEAGYTNLVTADHVKVRTTTRKDKGDV